MKEYFILTNYGSYVCKGSFIFNGEPYKSIGTKGYARRFKSQETAKKELEKLKGKYANIDDTCFIVCIENKDA